MYKAGIETAVEPPIHADNGNRIVAGNRFFRKAMAVPNDKWKISGYGPVATARFLVEDTEVQKRFFPQLNLGEPDLAKVKIVILGNETYGRNDQAISSVLMHQQAQDVHLQLTGIIDAKRAIYGRNDEEIPRALICYLNARVDSGHQYPTMDIESETFQDQIGIIRRQEVSLADPETDILILTSGHHSFHEDHAASMTGKIVIEAQRDVVTPAAARYMVDHGILFLPFHVVDTGWSYQLH